MNEDKLQDNAEIQFNDIIRTDNIELTLTLETADFSIP